MKIKIYFSAAFLLGMAGLIFIHPLFAQTGELRVNIDMNAAGVVLPKIFQISLDLSGRGVVGSHNNRPQSLASIKAIDAWDKDIGFGGFYRMQFNLWEIAALVKDKPAQDELLASYENLIKRVTDSGGTVLLNLFGMPAGMGRALDKKSSVVDTRAFKQLVKNYIRYFSCEKRYNLWYEVWSAPDSDDFFLGRKQDYFNLYRVIAEAVVELENETKVHIPVGGPAASWWFQDMDSNTIRTPEHSLIYGLIQFCFRYRLPLNFISWYAYSTDPKVDKPSTVYSGKSAVALIRDWQTYFNFSKDMPLFVSEWNYDNGDNFSQDRGKKSYIAASYIPARLRYMYEAGVSRQFYFSLEDFNSPKEGVVRNTGVFEFIAQSKDDKAAPKAVYNVLRMFSLLEDEMLIPSKNGDEFSGLIVTADKKKENLKIIVYNYIDTDIVYNYLSRTIGELREREKKALLKFIRAQKLDKLISGELSLSGLRLKGRLKAVLLKALELQAQAKAAVEASREVAIELDNFKGDYLYRRYAVDPSCGNECAFSPVEEKELLAPGEKVINVSLPAYSVQMIVLSKLVKLEPAGEEEAAPIKTENKADDNAAKKTNAQKITGAQGF